MRISFKTIRSKFLKTISCIASIIYLAHSRAYAAQGAAPGGSDSRQAPNLELLGYDFGHPATSISFINIIGFLLYIASNIIGIAGFIAIIYIMIGGITLVLSGGNEEQAQKGKKTLTYAVGGFILAVAAFLIVNTFLRYIVGLEIKDIPTEPANS